MLPVRDVLIDPAIDAGLVDPARCVADELFAPVTALPVVFGRGKYEFSFAPTGLMAEAGMTFPGNWVRVYVPFTSLVEKGS
jgi:hypothetical protein